MFDEKGRVWFTSRDPAAGQSGVLQRGIGPSFGEAVPARIAAAGNWRFTIPKTAKITLIDTCFGTHHLQFAEDANETLWTSSGGGGDVVGWLNVKMFEETHDEAEVAGLDGAGPGHQRERQARRVCRAESAGRSGQGQARRGGILRRDGEPRGRDDLGIGAGVPGADRAAQSRGRIRRRRRSPRCTKCRWRRDSRRAGSTSTRTASCGRCWRAGISRASTVANAKGR